MLGMYVHMYSEKVSVEKYHRLTSVSRIVKSKTQPLFWSGWASCKDISKHFFFKELFLIGFVIRLVKTAKSLKSLTHFFPVTINWFKSNKKSKKEYNYLYICIVIQQCILFFLFPCTVKESWFLQNWRTQFVVVSIL